MMTQVERLEAMLGQGHDSSLLRFGLGNAYLKASQPQQAIPHLAEAVRQDPGYSAAWKLYGQAIAMTGDHSLAIEIFEQGIATAEHQGDQQAAKEMAVFRRRSEKALSG